MTKTQKSLLAYMLAKITILLLLSFGDKIETNTLVFLGFTTIMIAFIFALDESTTQ